MIKNVIRGDENMDIEDFSEDYPTYRKPVVDSVDPVEIAGVESPENNSKMGIEPKKDENLKDEEMNVNPTPRYTSFGQIKKELVVLDLERKIAWEELLSVKHEFKEDLAPSNFVQPALKVVGTVSGLMLLKNLIFGR